MPKFKCQIKLKYQIPKLSECKGEVRAAIRSVRAGMNPAPTQQVNEPLVGAGFTPARRGYQNLEIAQVTGKLETRVLAIARHQASAA